MYWEGFWDKKINHFTEMADKIDKPLEFLKEEMESDQISVRVNAMTRTPIIAALIGNTAVEKDLVPYLDSRLQFKLRSDPKRR